MKLKKFYVLTIHLWLIMKMLQANLSFANNGNPLEEDQWQFRPLLVVTNKNCDVEKLTVLNALKKPVTKQAFNERNMVLYTVIDGIGLRNNQLLRPESVSALLASINVEKNSEKCTIILIGKDGEEKLKTEENISMESIFNLIDGMPMRMREAQKK